MLTQKSVMFSSKQHSLVKQRISLLRNQNKEIDYFFSKLEEYGDLILIGGAVRDIGMFNITPRDLDIIVNTTMLNLDNAFLQYNYHRNRFGGYKTVINSVEFDVWTINDNWAFKNNFLEHNIENIQHGAFYNIDSILVNLSGNYYEASYFNEAIEKRILDIILEDDLINENPSKEVNVLRAFVLKDKWELTFSNKLKNYIDLWLRTTVNPYSELEKAHYKHYKNQILNKRILSSIEEVLIYA
ncbi:hypothetical protein [Priestia megaterium]|uniref:hypothetical protein n=1 Tax=Priestia megaterium TaxID=1404 RepID=UPI00064CA222|nr:hypothetical protein [Priestia megaterium]KLV28947.1 hypothetical protein ABW04_26980 [Priestia megaterium]